MSLRNRRESADVIRRMSDEDLLSMIIKPCKHCGSKSIVICGDGAKEIGGWKLYCENCSIQTGQFIGDTPEQAILSWNRTPNSND